MANAKEMEHQVVLREKVACACIVYSQHCDQVWQLPLCSLVHYKDALLICSIKTSFTIQYTSFFLHDWIARVSVSHPNEPYP